MDLRNAPIVLAVSRRLSDFVWQIDQFYYAEHKEVQRIRQGEFLVNGIRYIFISADRPEQMLGFHGVKVEYWGSLIGVSNEKLDLIKHYKASAERP